MNIYDLYLEDGGKISYNGGNKKHGSCPVCGGKKRFWMNLDLPSEGLAAGIGWFKCGQKEGSGCGIKGDAIKYLEMVRKMSFVEACGYIGIDLNNNHRQNVYNTKRERYFTQLKKEYKHAFIPLRKKWPEQVEHPEIWQEHAEKFVTNCHDSLLQRQSCIDYLSGIGINLELIKKYRIGWHDGEEVKKKNIKYQNSYRPCISWGMVENKANQKFVLPAGIVIPSFDDTGVIRIKIRTTGLISDQPKYHVIFGSIKENRQQDIYNPGCEIVAVVESPLCGRMMAEILKNVTIIILGSANIRLCFTSVQEILNKKILLGCFDTDSKEEIPLWQQTGAAECLEWWPDNIKNFSPLLVPGCTWLVEEKRGQRVKDPGEYYQVGGDIAAWIKWGVVMYTPFSAPKKEVEGERAESVYIGFTERKYQMSPINRMIRWMRETGVVIRIRDNGCSFGFGGIRYATEQSREMSIILFNEFSEKCSHLLSDGIWSADMLVAVLKNC